MIWLFLLLVVAAQASYLPVVVQPITNYTNAPALACPTACPVTNYGGSAINDPEWLQTSYVNVTTFRKYPNATEDYYPNGTHVANSSSLTLQNNVMCFAQPSINIWWQNLTGPACDTISKNQIISFYADQVSGVASLENISVFTAIILSNMAQLQAIAITFLDVVAFTIANLPVLREIQLSAPYGVGYVTIANCSSLPYFNATNYSVLLTGIDTSGNIMGVLVRGFGIVLSLDRLAAFERLDVYNTTDVGGTILMDTKSERFLNSRPNCAGDFSGNVSYFISYCLPVDGAPGRDPLECPQPIAERCASNLYYNASCWLSEWNVTTFNISSPGVVKDCVFDANHWFNVTTLYVYDESIVLPRRIRYTNVVYLNTLTPTSNPSINPTSNPSKNPSINPTSNPSKNPTSNPSKNPTVNPSLNPTMPTFSPSVNPSRNPTLVR